jgi:hypothetical protein
MLLSWFYLCIYSQCYAKKEGIKVSVKTAFGIVLVLSLCLALQGVIFAADEPENFFLNPSFEAGIASWGISQDAGTVASFIVDDKDSIDGDQSALVTVDTAAGWGSQFGQSIAPGENGSTYTFAVLIKVEKGPVIVNLQVERSADPWDRALRGDLTTFHEGDEWAELHATFTVVTDFPQGWFAYISCIQNEVEYRADLFRLHEGDYIPYEDLVKPPQSVSASARSLVTTWGELKSGR